MADILTPDGNAIPPGDREPSPTIQGDDETVRGPHAGHTVAPGDTDDTNIPDTNLPSGSGPKFSVRCQPCSDRGRYSFCDKTWPICSKCAQEGTSDQCFHAYTDPPSHSDQPPPSPLITDQRGRPPPHPDVRTTRASAATLGPPPADLTRRAASATPTIHAPPVSARGLPQPLLDRRRSQSPPPPPATPREVSRVRSPPRMRSLQNLSEERQIQLERLEFLRTELRRAEQEAGLPPSQPFHPPTSATPAQTYAPVSHTATHNPPIGMHAHAHGTRRSDPDFISSSIYAGDFYAERKRPQVIPGLVGSREFAYIPDALRRAFTGPNAWTTGVSLWHFSDEYAMDPSKHARVNDTITLNENGQLVQHRGELPRVNESTLDVGTFIRCWQRANGLLHSIRHPDASVWEEHVRLMMRQPDFFTDFPKWLKYCGLVRQRALQQGIDPSVLQKGILSEVTVEYERNRLLADTRRCIREELDRRDAANSQRSHTPSSSSNIAPRIQPKQPQAPRGKGAVADSSKNPPICFLCGSPSHISTGCEHPSIAVRNAQGNWSVAGKTFCYRFNGTRGCTHAGCQKPHLCSLCSATGHSAQFCTTRP